MKVKFKEMKSIIIFLLLVEYAIGLAIFGSYWPFFEDFKVTLNKHFANYIKTSINNILD